MDRRRAVGGLAGEAGFATLQFVVAAALAMLVVVALVQVVAYQYARGAVMAGLERGARAGSVVGAGEPECHAALVDTFSATLGGDIGASLEFGCRADPAVISARASGTVPVWIWSGQLSFDLEVSARRETGS